MKRTYITSPMQMSRISECVEITDLMSDFRLVGDQPFSLFIHPKMPSSETVTIISAEPYAGEGFREMPVVLDNVVEFLFSAIERGGINLDNYRVWCVAGGAVKVAPAGV